MAEARAHPDARAIVLWRGKPLIVRIRPTILMRLPMDHPILQDATDAPIFLGREDGAPRFAFDLSKWEPDQTDMAALGGFLDPSEQHHPTLDDLEVFAELRRIMTWLSPRDAELAATAKAIIGWHDSHGFCAKCGTASEIADAGWRRACPACHTSHFPGFVEPGETLEAAVRREVFEESGVHVGQVDYLASQPWPFPASLMFGCHGVATSDKIQIDPVEIEDAMWVSREEMVQAFAGEHPRLLPARKGAIAHFLLENWLADTLD